MAIELKYNKNTNWWNSLDYKWKKQIYLNYRLSKEDINWRKRVFLDDNYGLDFVMCKILNLETDNPNNDLILLDNYVKNEIIKFNKTTLDNLKLIEELNLHNLDNLKPIENFPNLKLVYLDHCRIQDINTLKNINKLSFYETPDYPTNIPSLYHNTDIFSEKVKIIKNPFIEINKHFNTLTK